MWASLYSYSFLEIFFMANPNKPKKPKTFLEKFKATQERWSFPSVVEVYKNSRVIRQNYKAILDNLKDLDPVFSDPNYIKKVPRDGWPAVKLTPQVATQPIVPDVPEQEELTFSRTSMTYVKKL